MYPFPWLRPAWERMWDAVVRHVPSAPPALCWAGTVQDHWRDPDCAVAHACGWPVAAQLRGAVEVLGAFALTLPGSRGIHYRSVLLARDPAVLDRLDDGTLVAAANSPDSLSGWVSLLAGVGRSRWPGPVTWTGAHAASLRALAAGRADLACIDALSLRHLTAVRPSVVDGLCVVGHGPWIPNPAVVVRSGADPADRRRLVTGLRAAVTDPGLAATLHYDAFVPLGDEDYEPTRHLVPRAAE
jgi:ABC-type phosphate/phosphonate transport system substrate-binding protein